MGFKDLPQDTPSAIISYRVTTVLATSLYAKLNEMYLVHNVQDFIYDTPMMKSPVVGFSQDWQGISAYLRKKTDIPHTWR